MKTAKGSTYTTLLNVTIADGYMTTSFKVPTDLGTITYDDIAKMIPFINDKIITEKKPGATFEKCLEQVELHRDLYVKALVKLFETYQYATTLSPAVEQAIAMLKAMPDKMLRQYAELSIGDKANEYVLPSERNGLMQVVIAAIAVNGNGITA